MKFTLDELMETMPPTERLTVYDLRTDCLADTERREIDTWVSFKKRYAGAVVLCLAASSAHAGIDVIIDANGV